VAIRRRSPALANLRQPCDVNPVARHLPLAGRAATQPWCDNVRGRSAACRHPACRRLRCCGRRHGRRVPTALSTDERRGHVDIAAIAAVPVILGVGRYPDRSPGRLSPPHSTTKGHCLRSDPLMRKPEEWNRDQALPLRRLTPRPASARPRRANDPGSGTAEK